MNIKTFVIGFFLSVLFFGSLIGAGLWIYIKKNEQIEKLILSPIATKIKENKEKSSTDNLTENTIFKKDEIINILLIGIDRRNKSQTGFNTDTMILLSVNPKTNKVLLTSVPRDLWIQGGKINSLYTVFGDQTLLDAFEEITGQKIQGYIRADFSDIRWLVDAMGGVPINIENTFIDNQFPNDSDTGIVSVTYTQGEELMTGARALTFARSRKGDNGEGSDLKRAKRQHLILQGMIKGISQPQSEFWPMDVKKAYDMVTSDNKIHTTLKLSDVYYLWDFYKDRQKYQIESFVIGPDYIYHPGLYPQSQYHAWVFIPIGSSWSTLHNDIQLKLTQNPELSQNNSQDHE